VGLSHVVEGEDNLAGVERCLAAIDRVFPGEKVVVDWRLALLEFAGERLLDAGPVSALLAPAPVTLCWRGATPPSWLARPPQQRHCPPTHATGLEGGPGNTGNGSPNTSEKKQKHRNSLRRPVAAVAALAPVCWLAPAPGASSPESALAVGPRLPQHEPGDLDTRDSEGENEPTLWAAPILVLF
jgi:hypothetical protein